MITTAPRRSRGATSRRTSRAASRAWLRCGELLYADSADDAAVNLVDPPAVITGLVARVRIVTEMHTFAPVPEGAPFPTPVAGTRAFHEVQTSPLAFDATGRRIPRWAPHQPVPTTPAASRLPLPPDARAAQIGVLVDLELS